MDRARRNIRGRMEDSSDEEELGEAQNFRIDDEGDVEPQQLPPIGGAADANEPIRHARALAGVLPPNIVVPVAPRIPPPPEPRCWNDPPMVPAGGSTGGMRSRTLSRRVPFPVDGVICRSIPENIDDALIEVVTNLRSILKDEPIVKEVENIGNFWKEEAMNREVKVIVIKLSRHVKALEYMPAHLLYHQLTMHANIEWLNTLLRSIIVRIKPEDSD